MPRRYNDDDWDYRPRIPADGIKAKNRQGSFGVSWWGKRWVQALESFGYGSRLTRGRTYARTGAVLEITVTAGKVVARVQGSRSTPYKVALMIAQLNDTQWQKVTAAIAEQAIYAAKLLAGEMPDGIDELFAAAQVSLFPTNSRDLQTTCSCPDAVNPCKHIAAVHYLLGERFDADPFLLFELRGRSKSQLSADLRTRRSEHPDAAPTLAPQPVAETAPALADLLDRYDEPGEEFAQIAPQIAAPAIEAIMLRLYGEPPAGIGPELREVYRVISAAALA
ncbi:MAG: hypothetical protein HC822_05750 [Oscillochloris sp.]|nr:hypothetical protein [Oscillochloris sp.]